MTRAFSAVGVCAVLLGGSTFCAVTLPLCVAAQTTGATRPVTARLDTARSNVLDAWDSYFEQRSSLHAVPTRP